MKVLLDEQIPHAFRYSLKKEMPEHDFHTARFAQLTGDHPDFIKLNPVQKDTKLIEDAPKIGYDVLITTDTTIKDQQNISNLPINTLFVDVPPRMETLEAKLPEIKEEISLFEKSIEAGEKPVFVTIEKTPLPPSQAQSQQSPEPEQKQEPPPPPKPPANEWRLSEPNDLDDDWMP